MCSVSSEIVTLNVGGQRFATQKSNLTRNQDSMLAALLRTEVGVMLDRDGAIFVDRDPTCFQTILNYLRDGCIPEFLSERERMMLIKEADFYGLSNLAALASATKLQKCSSSAKLEISALIERTFTGWSKWGRFTPYKDIRGNYRLDDRFLRDARSRGPGEALELARDRLAWVESELEKLNAGCHLNKSGHYRDTSDPVPDELLVVSVQQAVNPDRMSKYMARKQQMLESYGDVDSLDHLWASECSPRPRTSKQKIYPLDERINEVYLWHGTSPDNARSILRDNFDMQKAGSTHGASYGRGAYLAESCLQADEYTSNEDGAYPLILSRVLLGKVYICRDPPQEPDKLERGFQRGEYDSVLGDREQLEETYREYIVYDSAQVLPEFLVWYHKRFYGYMAGTVGEDEFRAYT